MSENDRDGYVIVHTANYKRNGYISCEYVSEEDAEKKFYEILAKVRFPEELLCRKAILKTHGDIRYYVERD